MMTLTDNRLFFICLQSFVLISMIVLYLVAGIDKTSLYSRINFIVNKHDNDTRYTREHDFSPTYPWPKAYDVDNWQEAIPNTTYVYAAHLEPSYRNITQSTIKIIGTMRGVKENSTIDIHHHCKIWIYSDQQKERAEVIVQRVYQIVRTAGIRIYSNVQFICKVEVSGDRLRGAIVSIVEHPSDTATVFMHLRQNHKRGIEHEFTVCVERPVFGKISARRFVEFIEMNKILGAEKILIHNYSMPHNLDPVVKHYVSEGFLEVLQWHFHGELKKAHGITGGMHCELQQSMITDCQLRLRNWSRYIVVIDLDEFIIPRHPQDFTWLQMMERNNCKSPRSYIASHFYFGQELVQEETFGLVTLDTTHRGLKILPSRSKYIASTLMSPVMWTHKTANGGFCVLNTTIGGLHHYRSKLMKVYRQQPNVTDTTMLKYKDKLLQNVREFNITVQDEQMNVTSWMAKKIVNITGEHH